ncbi:MAG: hypothetical protein AAFX87_24925 [Bacteroidota bacterium]
MDFNFDINKFLVALIPPFLRRARMLAWLRVLVAPVRDHLYQREFLSFRAFTEQELRRNGQTLKLQEILNDEFDPVERRVRILHEINLLEPKYFLDEANREERYKYFVLDQTDIEPPPGLETLDKFFVNENVTELEDNADFMIRLGFQFVESRNFKYFKDEPDGVLPIKYLQEEITPDAPERQQPFKDFLDDFDESPIRNVVDKYRIAGKKYIITR